MKNTNSAAESGSFVRKTRGYSVVQNEALFNDSLSMSAKGLYALIAARIDYTAVPLTKQWLMNHCTEGERAFNRAWDMLKIMAIWLRTFVRQIVDDSAMSMNCAIQITVGTVCI